jgi:AAHS family 4-hydroxybenzoate transporter-like MFS transporter
MSSSQVVNVDELIDNQPLRPANLAVLGLLLLALLSDGFDLQVLSFAAGGLVRDWGIERAALAPVFSANLVGMMVGAMLLGYVGDRFGRKRMIVVGTLLYGLACLSCLAASNLLELGALRFLTGVGLGGVLPNVIALTAETTPRRWRAMLTSVVVIGMTGGSSLPTLVATTLVPVHGWQALFWVGGIAPLIIASLLALALPESLTFLAAHGLKRATVERRVKQIDPSLQITPETRFVVRAHEQAEGGLGRLFAGSLRVTTPLLWVMFAGTLLSMFMLTSWLPLLLEGAGLAQTQAASITGWLHIGGTISAACTALVLGRFGLMWVALLLTVAAISVTIIALTGFSPGLLTPVVFAAGFGIIGCQTALNTSAAMIYPSAFRPTGVGAALSVGRIGSIIGPLVGGALIAAGIATQRMFFVPLLPLGLAILSASVLLMRGVDIRTADKGLAH